MTSRMSTKHSSSPGEDVMVNGRDQCLFFAKFTMEAIVLFGTTSLYFNDDFGYKVAEFKQWQVPWNDTKSGSILTLTQD